MTVLRARELYRFYRVGDEETLALRGVSLAVPGGKLLTVAGPSGSGKSTLLACLAGLDEPDGGSVYIRETRISHRPEHERSALRARHIGHVIFNSIVDRPWSEYFCCMLVGNGDYVRNYPNATKRVLRAILKGADLCASEPARVAQRLVDRGFTDRYDYAVDALSGIPYGAWREYDPEDTLRYYALRLHEAGFIKSSPNKIIAESTNWRFLNELKRELKA